jgi:hypothetical protein
MARAPFRAHNRTDHLVPGYQGKMRGRRSPLDLIEFRMADSARAYPDQDLPVARNWLGNIREPEGRVRFFQIDDAGDQHGFHDRLLSFCVIEYDFSLYASTGLYNNEKIERIAKKPLLLLGFYSYNRAQFLSNEAGCRFNPNKSLFFLGTGPDTRHGEISNNN